MKIEEFGQKIKTRYPQYQDIPDADLGQKMLTKYPEYKDLVDVVEKPKKSGLQKATDIVTSIFPGKQVGQAIGTAVGAGIAKVQGNYENYDLSAPSPTQVVGDVAQGALTVAAPSVGKGATALGRIGANTALGAGIGASGAVAKGEGVKEVAKDALVGGAIGGGVSALGEGVKSLSENLPKWLTKAALPKLENKNVGFATENIRVGSLKSLKDRSSQSMSQHEDTIQNILKQQKAVPVDTEIILNDAVGQFPNSDYTPDNLLDNAKNIAPKVSKLIAKLKDGSANIKEINTIRKELDSATKSVYTSLNRPPEAKLLGATLADSLREYVKKTAPGTVPVFKEYSQEIGLNKAIAAAIKKGEQKITFKDIMAGGAGYSQGGLSGALKAIIAERLLFNPAGQIGLSKAIQGASKVAAPVGTTLLQGGKAPLVKKITD